MLKFGVGFRYLEMGNVSEIDESEGEGENVVEEESNGGNGGSSERVDKLFDESSERDKMEEIEECLSTKDEIEETEFVEGEKNDDDDDGDGGINKVLFDEEEDWVGIERTELEKLFGAALVYIGSTTNVEKVLVLGKDVKMKLYALHKIATQGPCLEPQPMALKLSARAKW